MVDDHNDSDRERRRAVAAAAVDEEAAPRIIGGARRIRAERGVALANDLNTEERRKQTMYCYALGIVLLLMTPFYDCGDANWHMITEKTWIIVFSTISVLQLLKEKLKEKIDKMHRDNEITYRTRSRMLVGMTPFGDNCCVLAARWSSSKKASGATRFDGL